MGGGPPLALPAGALAASLMNRDLTSRRPKGTETVGAKVGEMDCVGFWSLLLWALGA